MATVEERLTAVETELRELKLRVTGSALTGDWLARVLGGMADFPEFEEVLRLGREFRESVRDLPEENNGVSGVHP